MTLTIVTDHRFFLCNSNIYDDYVFDYNFFKTYLNVFDEIKVVARVKKISEVSKKYYLSSGDRITFIPLKDVHGIKWFLFSSFYLRKIRKIIFETDGFCFVLPSLASWQIYKLNKNKIPFMFHSIGDPEDSMIPSRVNFFTNIIYTLIGKILKYKKKKIIYDANIGSYVSFSHLQNKYPVKQGVFNDSISSIRLNSSNILDSEKNFSESVFKFVHVGSFIPLKNQKDLIYCLQFLLEINENVELHLVGSGPLMQKCKKLTNQLGIQKKVHFYGQVTGVDEIVKILDNCDFFILPSSNEGMPRAMIEAMSRGLICFGSDVGGVSELLKKEFTFKPGNLDQMILVICRFLATKKRFDYQEISYENIKFSKRFKKEKLEIKRKKLLLNFKKIINENNI